MRETREWTSRGAADEDAAPDLLKVRHLLLGLPRLCCPAGLEFRIQRSLREPAGRVSRVSGGWGVRLAGLGLGFAAALLVAVFVFDFNLTSGPAVLSTGRVTAVAPSQNPAPPVEQQLIAGSPANEIKPTQVSDRAAEMAPQMAAAKDSGVAKHSPTALPENLYHQVGGGGR